MTLDPEGSLAGDTGAQAAESAKTKGRKKKTAEAVALPHAIVEAGLEAAATEATAGEVVGGEPAKKAAKKTAARKEKAVEAGAEVAAKEPKPDSKAVKAVKKRIGKKATANQEDADGVPATAVAPPEAVAPGLEAELKVEEAKRAPKPEPQLERLQKILAKAGISSRRKAEELIAGGQVQINGKVVTELGTKADPERDHIRVGGKLLQGPERLRYFVLNKPKGYVTTVSDPEGRPTVMQFFATERERLYPVGRLDYLSEGLLLVTNDGDLANKLTKAASGVEKTYLVKVAGQPTEDMLSVLRTGVVIDRGRPGEHTGRVRTAPAKIRQVRQGDNPWYEVIIIEGRNRELRKMFEEIGHHVEKIRRVGYGPLVLDLEPGKLRELEAEEVDALRLAAAGKLKKSKRSAAAGQLPTVAGRPVRYKKPDGRPGYEPRGRVRAEFQAESRAEFKPAFRAVPKSAFKPTGRSEFKAGTGGGSRPAFPTGVRGDFQGKAGFKSEGKPDFKPDSKTASSSGSGFGAKADFHRLAAPDRGSNVRPPFRPTGRPEFKAGGKPGGRPNYGDRPRPNRAPEPEATELILPPRKARPAEAEVKFEAGASRRGGDSRGGAKPGFRTGEAAKPAFRRDQPGSRPAFRGNEASGSGKPRTGAGARGAGTPPLGRYNAADDDFVPRKTPGFRIEPVEERPRTGSGRADSPRPSGKFERPGSGPKPFRASGPRSGAARTGSIERPLRPRPETPGTRGPSERRSKPFGGATEAEGGDRSGGAKGFGAGKKFAGKSFAQGRPGAGGRRTFAGAKPAPGGRNSVPSNRVGPEGQPRVKERHRNSFTGKNKGRPKPKSKPE